MLFVVGVILFAVGIGLSIALHEFGHLLTAKAFKMKATQYFIGFGPKLFSFHRGETEYGLKAIPAGGYVRITGMTALEKVAPEDQHRAFVSKPIWQRVIVLAAGSVTHFILGVLILFTAACTTGLPNIQSVPVIGGLGECVGATQDPGTGRISDCAPGEAAPARQAGLRSGDLIVSVGGVGTPTQIDVIRATRELTGPTPFVIERDGQRRTVTVEVVPVQRLRVGAKPGEGDQLVTVGAVGLGFARELRYDVLEAVPATVDMTGTMFHNTWIGLKKLPEKLPAVWYAIQGQDDPERPVSVVGASIIGGDAAKLGAWSLFLMILAALNFFIGVFNLLPLLPLDGGHVAVNLYEWVRDRIRRLRGLSAAGPVDYTKLLPLTYVVIVLGGIMVLLTVTADIVNPIRLGQ